MVARLTTTSRIAALKRKQAWLNDEVQKDKHGGTLYVEKVKYKGAVNSHDLSTLPLKNDSGFFAFLQGFP